MILSEFINESLGRFGDKETSRRSREMVNQCRRQLEAYAEHVDYQPHVIDLINPDFVSGFCDWLYDEYAEASGAQVVDKWIECFWRVARSAIRLGYIPKIDLVREVREKLAKVHKAKGDTESKKTRGGYEVKSPDFKEEYQRLVKTIALMNARADTSLDSRAKSVLLYMCSMALGGLEFSDIIKVECRAEKDEDDLTSLKLYIPRYDIMVDFDGVPLVVWRLYHDHQNSRPESGAKLFPGLDCDDEAQFRADVTSFCVQHRIELFRAKSVLCDFLSLAYSSGKNREDVIRFAQLRNAAALEAHDLPVLHKLLQTSFDPLSLLQADWRILRVYTLRSKISTVIEAIDRLAKISVAQGENFRIKQFAPVEEVVSKRPAGRMRRKKVPVFGSYIFVKSRRPEAEMIERSIPDVSFMRQCDNRRLMVTLTNREILRLRSFFSDYRDGVSEHDLVDIDQWRADHAASLDEGQRVRILHGPFAGYEGIVYQIKNFAADEKAPEGQLTTNHPPLTTGSVVVVRVTPMSNLSIVTLTASVDPLHLQPL